MPAAHLGEPSKWMQIKIAFILAFCARLVFFTRDKNDAMPQLLCSSDLLLLRTMAGAQPGQGLFRAVRLSQRLRPTGLVWLGRTMALAGLHTD